MKVVKWILIALAVVVITVLTLPVGGFSYSSCEHSYQTLSCDVKECTKCGKVIDRNIHHWQRTDSCTKMYCTKCGKTKVGYHDYEYVACTNQRVCRICGHKAYSGQVHHAEDKRIEYVDCTYEYVCTQCGEITHTGISHTWSEYEQCQDAYCLFCGITAPKSVTHNAPRISNMFDLPSVCQDCGEWCFPPLNFSNTCVYLGVVFTIVAAVFIFLNRKRIHIREGRYIGIVTPDAQLRERGTEEEYC